MVSPFGRQFLLAALLAPLCLAKLLNEPPACDNTMVEIDSQADLDVYQTCPVITSTLFFIDHEFDGVFTLPNVQSIPKLSAGYLGPSLGGATSRTDDGVSSVSMPDLKNTSSGGMLFGYLGHLTDVSLPHLAVISGDLAIIGNPRLRNLSFPALSNIGGGVLLDGHFDQIDLPALKSVLYLQIKSTGNISCPALGAAFASVNFTAGKDDTYRGFTCWTGHQDNSWDSTDPKHNPKGDASGSGSGSGSGSDKNKSAASTLAYSYPSLAMVLLLCVLL